VYQALGELFRNAEMSDSNQPEFVSQKVRNWLIHPGNKDSYGYGFVLLLIAISFVLTSISSSDVAWVRFVINIVQGVTLIVALQVSHARSRTLLMGIALVFIAVSLMGIFSVIITSAEYAFGLSHLVGALFLAFAIVAIVNHIVRQQLIINGQTILAALCIYLSIGMFFAYFYSFIAFLTHSFFASVSNPTIEDFLYFSFITLTTVGYGDLVPIGNLPRTIVVIEALLGQSYLVTFVSLIVGNFGRDRSHRIK
jgi:Ion channel